VLRRALTLTACVLLCSACTSEDKSAVVTDPRNLADFSKITAGGAMDVDIKIGSPQSVVIECNKDSLADIDTEVNDGELIVSIEDNARPTHLAAHIVVPKLDSLEVAGSTETVVAGVHSKAFSLTTAGSAKVEAQGEVDDLQIELSGSSDLNAGKLKSKTCSITISGSGNADVYASQSLDANIAGSGIVKVHGNPPKLNQQIEGSGSIEKL